MEANRSRVGQLIARLGYRLRVKRIEWNDRLVHRIRVWLRLPEHATEISRLGKRVEAALTQHKRGVTSLHDIDMQNARLMREASRISRDVDERLSYYEKRYEPLTRLLERKKKDEERRARMEKLEREEPQEVV